MQEGGEGLLGEVQVQHLRPSCPEGDVEGGHSLLLLPQLVGSLHLACDDVTIDL